MVCVCGVFICECNSICIPSSVPADDCDHALYRKDNESLCYFVTGSYDTFNDMVKECKDYGATMAVVDTKEKLQHIKDIEILSDYGYIILINTPCFKKLDY